MPLSWWLRRMQGRGLPVHRMGAVQCEKFTVPSGCRPGLAIQSLVLANCFISSMVTALSISPSQAAKRGVQSMR